MPAGASFPQQGRVLRLLRTWHHNFVTALLEDTYALPNDMVYRSCVVVVVPIV